MRRRITRAPEGGMISAIASKSQAHRLVIAGALSDAENRIITGTASADIEATRACMERIREAVKTPKESREPYIKLPAGESGSTLRFLVPLASALGISSDFIMEGRLPERPMGPLLEQLSLHGIRSSRPDHGTLRIEGELYGGIFELPGNLSSQYVTGLLMALPLIPDNSEIKIIGELQSRPYVDITLDVLRRSGIDVIEDDGNFYIPGNQKYSLKGEVTAEGDWSNAAFWLAAGAIGNKGQEITVRGIDPGSVQGDKAVLDILKEMGADIACEESAEIGKSIKVRGSSLKGTVIDARNIPDLVPAIAVLAAAAEGKTVITNAERLRLKESDRIESISHVLNDLGADVITRPDGLEITGGRPLKGGKTDSHNDHRIAMMAACLRALSPEGPDGDIVIEGAQAVGKSYPGFFEDYEKLGGKTEEAE